MRVDLTPFVLSLALGLALLGCGPIDSGHSHEGPAHLQEQVQRMQIRTMLRLMPDPADLRPEARKYINQLVYNNGTVELPDLSTQMFTSPPKTIKIWQRSKGGSKSCDGPIITLNMEDYIKGVLPHEWITSWHKESLRAGAVAIRSYASSWVNAGGKYTCADLCDTTYSQVYKPATKPVTNQAVDDTKSQVVLKSGKIPSTEYSAENSSYPTWYGATVNDTATCAGKTKYGHGRGMCQWGSQRWALKGKGYAWIVAHYYPGSSLWKPTSPKPDTGPPPKLDKGAPPPKLDKGAPPPKLDKGTPPPKKDTGLPPKLDRGQPPKKDKGTPPRRDSGVVKGDLPTSASNQAYHTLTGGCAVGSTGTCPPWALLTLLLICAARRRKP